MTTKQEILDAMPDAAEKVRKESGTAFERAYRRSVAERQTAMKYEHKPSRSGNSALLNALAVIDNHLCQICEHEDSFLERFFDDKGDWSIADVYFSSSELKVYYAMHGRWQVPTTVSLIDYLSWLDDINSEGI